MRSINRCAHDPIEAPSRALISLTDLRIYIQTYFFEHNAQIGSEDVYEIINAAATDFFVTTPDPELGHLAFTLKVLLGQNVMYEKALELAMTLNQLFTSIIDTYRLSENLDSIDKTRCEILSCDLMLLQYDPEKA